MRALTFLIYIILWDGSILAGTTYLVFWMNESGWWYLLAMVLMSTSFKPGSWIYGKKPFNLENTNGQ